MIAIGGSLGGSQALREILQRLPAGFPVPIGVVLHRQRDQDGSLVPLLQSSTSLQIVEVEDKTPIERGHLYVCPADYHLLLDQGCFALSTDDLVHYARPSIDVFFESVAEWERRRAVAVILTGGGTDGTQGAKRIHEAGGTVLIQDPQTAEGPWMPTSAAKAVPAARVLTLPQIAEALLELAGVR